MERSETGRFHNATVEERMAFLASEEMDRTPFPSPQKSYMRTRCEGKMGVATNQKEGWVGGMVAPATSVIF